MKLLFSLFLITSLYSGIQHSILTFSIHSKEKKIFNQAQLDSLKIDSLKKVIRSSYIQKKWDTFHKARFEQIKLSSKQKDSQTLAKTLQFSGAFFKKRHKIDSAYFYFYKSFKVYDNIKDSLNAGKILVSLAILQKNTRDYRGSEQTSFKAISYLTPSQNTRRISSMHNNLGVIYNELDDVVNAIKYHKKALEYRKKLNKPLYLIHSYNNIGKLYRDNEQYEEAFNYFEKALSYKTILDTIPTIKASIVDNYNHTFFMTGKKEGIIETSLATLSIREKENDKEGIIINCIHLAEYFDIFGDRKKAILYAEKAEQISLETKNFRDYLVSLELISNLYDTPNAKRHFKKYIQVRDSLDKVALRYKNQFDRIRFETDEKEQRIEQQSKALNQKQNFIYSILIILVFIVLVILTIYYKRKKAKEILKEKLTEGFDNYLKNKYSLSNQNLEFWKIWVVEHGQNQIAEKLFITVNAVKSRRKSLRDKVYKVKKIQGDFDQAKAIILYNKELEFYKANASN